MKRRPGGSQVKIIHCSRLGMPRRSSLGQRHGDAAPWLQSNLLSIDHTRTYWAPRPSSFRKGAQREIETFWCLSRFLSHLSATPSIKRRECFVVAFAQHLRRQTAWREASKLLIIDPRQAGYRALSAEGHLAQYSVTDIMLARQFSTAILGRREVTSRNRFLREWSGRRYNRRLLVPTTRNGVAAEFRLATTSTWARGISIKMQRSVSQAVSRRKCGLTRVK